MKRWKRRTLAEVSAVGLVGYMGGYVILGYPVGRYVTAPTALVHPGSDNPQQQQQRAFSSSAATTHGEGLSSPPPPPPSPSNPGSWESSDTTSAASAPGGTSTTSVILVPLIPDVLHFTYAFDLLRRHAGSLTPVEKLLRANVEALAAMHGGARVVFTDDAACDAMLRGRGGTRNTQKGPWMEDGSQ
jgi:hypothetical protein